MGKITVKQFGLVQNYNQLMEQVPGIFARIIALENSVNELQDQLDQKRNFDLVQKPATAGLMPQSGRQSPPVSNQADKLS